MDAFFASVEQRDNPALRGKPVAVGGTKRRGVVAAASYEARRFGVHSAMPSFKALELCPQLIFVRGSFEKYKEASDIMNEIFHSYTDLVEPVSLDEAYLDVTENKPKNPSATRIAREIKRKILDKTRLTASAGVSFNKFLAKIASDFKKPDGLTVVTPKEAEKFIDALPVKKIPGVGKVTREKMKAIGINTGADLRRASRFFMQQHFGKVGDYFYDLVRCNYDSPVVPHRIRKQVGAERTFERDIAKREEMFEALHTIAHMVSKRLAKKDTMGKTVTLKIKYNDFIVNTRSRTYKHLLQSGSELFECAKELLLIPVAPIKPLRLLGISVSNLDNEPEKRISRQLTFDFYESEF